MIGLDTSVLVWFAFIIAAQIAEEIRHNKNKHLTIHSVTE